MRLIVIVLFLFNTDLLHSQSAKNIYLGVLETRRAGYSTALPDDSVQIKVERVLFRFQNNRWYSLENDIGNSSLYPSKQYWYIAFDGKLMGEFSSTKASLPFKDDPWTYPRDAFHIPQNKNLPTIGKASKEFTGWVFDDQPRPLVTISEPNYSDPEVWKPFNPGNEEMEALKSLYYNHADLLNLDRTDMSNDSKLEFGKSYASSNADKLIQICEVHNYNGQKYVSDKVWFYKSHYGEIIDLSKAIDLPFRGSGDSETSSLYVVDVGDYDNDGYSDVLFWIDRYDGNGYALFYNNFSNFVTFEWIYH